MCYSVVSLKQSGVGVISRLPMLMHRLKEVEGFFLVCRTYWGEQAVLKGSFQFMLGRRYDVVLTSYSYVRSCVYERRLVIPRTLVLPFSSAPHPGSASCCGTSAYSTYLAGAMCVP